MVCLRRRQDVSRRRVVALVAAALTSLLVGCDGSSPSSDPISPAATRSPASVGLVSEKKADLNLWVSNQSFVDDPVDLTVRIDGVEVVSQPFDVDDQHNWIRFSIEAAPGHHVLTAESDTGASTRKNFSLPGSGDRHAVLEYWNYEDDKGKRFTWKLQSTEVHFD
jgi:hypothetical protein